MHVDRKKAAILLENEGDIKEMICAWKFYVEKAQNDSIRYLKCEFA